MSDSESAQDTNEASEPSTHKRQESALRVWPALFLLLGMIVSFIPDLLNSGVQMLQGIKMMGPALCGILILLWWLFASRARWKERLLGLLGVAAGFCLTLALVDTSMFGVPTIMVTIPMGLAAFATGVILCRNQASVKRVTTIVVMAALGFGFSTLLRGGGVVGGTGSLVLDWRFVQSPEQRLVANRSGNSSRSDLENWLSDFDPTLVDKWLASPEWDGFRGPNRDGSATGALPDMDWASHPPKKMWTIPAGPGWSSFSVAGQLLFTQEQRGEMETVVCYAATTGKELWVTGIEARFEDSIGGPGPRATPTIADGDLFVLGASGQLMRIDAKSGEIKWQTDLRDVAKRKPPTWGFSASPLVVGSLVIVHAGGKDNLGTLAFNTDDGKLAWSVPAGDHSYSSPQICRINGKAFVTMVTNFGVDLIDVDAGKIALTYEWKEPGYRSLQPTVAGDDSLLIPNVSGSRLIRFTEDDGQLTAEEVWTSRSMKPDFNDLVVFEDHAYGFDGSIFACIDLETGKRAWKGGRYGKGQVLLLQDAGLLLVASEYGDLVLLKASSSGHEELALFPAIEGKTWNHPVVVGNRIFVRNSTEAACFQIVPSAQ